MAQPQSDMSLKDAIANRRAVRSFTPQQIDQDTIRKLLDAAVHAPTAMHQEPWAFAVIQDQGTLKRLTKRSGELLALEAHTFPPDKAKRLLGYFDDPNFSVCYNANTLIVIYGKPMGPFVAADCWLAAENLMLAATAFGLGTCVIGLALPTLNTPEWRAELSVPDSLTAYVAIIVGEPSGETPPTPRKEPEILAWRPAPSGNA